MGERLTDVDPDPSQPVRTVEIDKLDPNPFQPRTIGSDSELETLAESIRVQGILQPLLVRTHPVTKGRYQIVAGERRWRAAALAGLSEVPVLHRNMTDAEAAATALVENLQRLDLNPIEEAEGLQRLISEFDLTHEALGHAVSKSRAHVGNMVRLLKLPARVQDEIRKGTVTFGHARALLTAADPGALTDQILARGLSVRQTESLAAQTAAEAHTPAAPRQQHPDTAALVQDLIERLGYRVGITTNANGGGRLVIHFRDSLHLDELVSKLT
jgi:ParB family chromosome partitioning protein